MAHDFYELLEIPDNANEIWIRRAYARQRELLEQDTTLSVERRQAKIAAVEDAFTVLSNPAMRHVYDADRLKLPKPARAKAKTTGLTQARLTVWGIVALLTIGTTWAYWKYAKEEERLRQEQERGAAEVAAYVRDIEARDKAERAAFEKIGSSIERQLAKDSVNPMRVSADSSEPPKTEDVDIKNELGGIQTERTRIEKQRKAEAKRLRQSAGQ